MKYQVMRIKEDGTLVPAGPLNEVTFLNPIAADNLAYQLSLACKDSFTVHQIQRVHYST